MDPAEFERFEPAFRLALEFLDELYKLESRKPLRM